VSPLVFRLTALWYIAQRSQPVRIVVVRDPTGRRRDEAFFCTDCRASAFILDSYAHRWTLEVAFHDVKQCLGFEDPQNQTPEAVRRTAPLAFVSYDLILLSAATCARQGQPVHWIHRPWYRSKSAPSFADMLTAVRFSTWPRLGLLIHRLVYGATKTGHRLGLMPCWRAPEWRKSSLAQQLVVGLATSALGRALPVPSQDGAIPH
jgi:hypothetical protein